jgi:hypothetical protein
MCDARAAPMTTYVGPVRRIKSGNSHYYVDSNGARVPGVTTMTKGVPSEALMNWGPKVTAEYAVDNWDELSDLPPAARLNRLLRSRFENKDAAANRGHDVHDIAEEALKGNEVDVPDLLAGHVESLIHMIDSYHMQPVLTETVVFSHTHGYAGTLDVVADFPYGLPGPHPWTSTVLAPPGLRLLCDWKTNRGKIYGETALQLTGYERADTYMDSEGNEQPMLLVDGCAAIHITADGFDLVPVTVSDETLRILLAAKITQEFSKNSRDYVGDGLRQPATVQRRRLEIISDSTPFGIE